MGGIKDTTIDLLDSVLGETMTTEDKEIQEIVKRITKSKKFLRFYIQIFKLHREFDPELKRHFYLTKEIKIHHFECHRFIKILLSLKLGSFEKKSKKLHLPQRFGLRNVRKHVLIIELIGERKKAGLLR